MKIFFASLRLCTILTFLVNFSFGQETTLLLKNGHVIDPKNNIDAVMDIAISFDKIIKVAPNIPAANAIR
ncbi:MAG: hypothetical protein KA143_14865, partial [Saprospiraceae bacterium]|nr:hypothetical protein [Saprospiraceae bacterium]